jgi:hypothetical protein
VCRGVRHGVFFPFAVGRLIATFKGKIALPKPGIRQNRRSCGGTAGISTSFFASSKNSYKKRAAFCNSRRGRYTAHVERKSGPKLAVHVACPVCPPNTDVTVSAI